MGDGVRHQAFPAGLVQGAWTALDHRHVESGPGAVHRGGQSGRAAAGDEQVDHRNPASVAFSTRSRVRSRAALTAVNSSAVIQALWTSGRAKPSTITAT